MCTLTDDPDAAAEFGEAPATDARVSGEFAHPAACRAIHEREETPLGELCDDGVLCAGWDDPAEWQIAAFEDGRR